MSEQRVGFEEDGRHRATRTGPRPPRDQWRGCQRHGSQARADHDGPARGPGLLRRLFRPFRGVVGVNGKAAFRTSVGRDAEAHFLPYPDAYRWPREPGGPALACEGALAGADRDRGSGSGIGPLAAIASSPSRAMADRRPAGRVPAGPPCALRYTRNPARVRRDPVRVRPDRPLWAAEHTGVVPDLMTVGKGIGGGLALSAVLGRRRCSTGRRARTHRRSSGTP